MAITPTHKASYIDNYRNPHMYTRSAISRATGENQYALGRVLGLEVSHSSSSLGKSADWQSFRRQLEESIGTEFPTIPLPPRKHQPVLPNGVAISDEKQLNGPTGQSGGTTISNGDVKSEWSAQETNMNNDQAAAANGDGQH
jgi:mediator of RNA polymerase II transcription subunit 10